IAAHPVRGARRALRRMVKSPASRPWPGQGRADPAAPDARGRDAKPGHLAAAPSGAPQHIA
ncbi:hypothetical protein, partial [Burkholderia gladioli]|uniref:hypothetical protein n=1 Tax=Burkholderia gladioli TaxID=28095 RepID=UPI0039E74963